MSAIKGRIVLVPSVSQSDVHQVAFDCDWQLDDVGDTSADVYVDVWFSADESVEIHYVEDDSIGLNYITLQGEEIEEVRRQIEVNCQYISFDEALVNIRRTASRDDRLRAIYAAALSAPEEPNEVLINEFRAIAHGDEDAGIRQAVIIATGYLPWPPLIELVEELRADDPEDFVRENAGLLLEGLRRYPPSSGR